MTLQNRIQLLARLRNYLLEGGPEWQRAREEAGLRNGWFTPGFVEQAVSHIARQYLDPDALQRWIRHYHLNDSITPREVGVVMAGNIPLVGFHDFLSVFITGHRQVIKLSSKDEVLMQHLLQQLYQWEPALAGWVRTAPQLKGCDAYIATGSNNSATRFDYYFSRYPSIIRRNRTSAALLTGTENAETLEKLSADVHDYFGLGCRNVTHLYVPQEYDFVPLLQAFRHYAYFADHHKYRNNYDYNLSLYILNNRFYMTDGATLLVEDEALFAPVSQLNYSYYQDAGSVLSMLRNHPDIQCIAGTDVPFGHTQQPGLMDYADGVDTIQFLLGL